MSIFVDLRELHRLDSSKAHRISASVSYRSAEVTLGSAPAQAPASNQAPPRSTPELTPAVLRELAELETQRGHIEAIKRYRDLFQVGLHEAKEVVDRLARQGAFTAPTAAATTPALSPALLSELIALVAERRLIEAIKRYREVFNVGLREAKDAVDALAKEVP